MCCFGTTQSSSQFMRHAKRRKLTVEDFNRALRWSNVEVTICDLKFYFDAHISGLSQSEIMSLSPCVHQAICGYGAQDSLPFRSVKEGELFFIEERDINLVELALATNIPKGCAETMVRGMTQYTVANYRQEVALMLKVHVSGL